MVLVSVTTIKETLADIWISLIWLSIVYQEAVSAKPALSSPRYVQNQFTQNPLQMTTNSLYHDSYLRRTSPLPYADDIETKHSSGSKIKHFQKFSPLVQRGTLHTFKSSICYDISGKANLGLRCPSGYEIQTVVAFTALSRIGACSYDVWDCILQEGVTQRCDGRNQCSISAIYEESIEMLMSCGSHVDRDVAKDKSMYFQVEYECIADNGIKAVASQPETSTTFILLNLEDVVRMNGTFVQDFNDTESAVNDKTALVAILGGSTLGGIILMAVISTCIYRIKNRATKLDGSRTGRITSGISAMSSEGVHTDPELMRQPRRNFQYDYRRQLDRSQPFGRGLTIWNGRSTTYVENDEQR